MPVAVVTGANSGIGNALAALLISKGYTVHALDATIGDPIQSLKCAHHEVNVTSPDSIAAFSATLGSTPVDLLLNIAGIMIKPSADTLSTSTPEAFTTSFAVNATGVFLLTQALIPNLLAASPLAKIAIMSSRVGSMADNSSGGAYAYRASKAAVNSVGVSLAMDLKEKGIAVFLLHPGINDTNLGGGMKGYPGLIEPRVTAERFVKLLGEWGMNETGKFFQYEGNELPW